MTKPVHMFPGQGDFPVRALTRALARDTRLRTATEEVLGLIDGDHALPDVPALEPWLLGRRPPDGRALAAAPTGTEQIALYAACLSLHTVLADRFGAPAAVLGVSFGEIAALAAAGVVTVREGARLAHALARVLATAPGGLLLVGCGAERAARLCGPPGTPDLAVACVNHDQETVMSGPLPQLERLEERARAVGVEAVRLRLPFSAHHPALTAQAERFADAVRNCRPRPARIPVYSAVAGRRYDPGDDLARRLADCLIRPAHLPDIAFRLRDDGYVTFREAGPGGSLARATRRVLPQPHLTVLTALPATAPEAAADTETAPAPSPGVPS